MSDRRFLTFKKSNNVLYLYREHFFDFRENPVKTFLDFVKNYTKHFDFRDYFRPYRIPIPEIIQGAAAYPGIKSSFFSRLPM